MNPMTKVYIEKVVLNIGTGTSEEKLQNAMNLLERITQMKPVKAKAKTRNPTFGIRKGSPIGAFVTLRGKKAEEIFEKALESVNKKIKKSSISENTLTFGLRDYMGFGIKYDPKIGIMGMDVTVTFAKPGLRVKRRKIARSKVGKELKVSKEEIIEYLNEKGVKIE